MGNGHNAILALQQQKHFSTGFFYITENKTNVKLALLKRIKIKEIIFEEKMWGIGIRPCCTSLLGTRLKDVMN